MEGVVYILVVVISAYILYRALNRTKKKDIVLNTRHELCDYITNVSLDNYEVLLTRQLQKATDTELMKMAQVLNESEAILKAFGDKNGKASPV